MNDGTDEPLTLREIDDWLEEVDSVASITRDSEFADRLLLINLLAALDRSKMIDARQLLKLMSAHLSAIEGGNYKLATKILIDDCHRALDSGVMPSLH